MRKPDSGRVPAEFPAVSRRFPVGDEPGRESPPMPRWKPSLVRLGPSLFVDPKTGHVVAL